MIASGFDVALRTFFIWEGVTNYLTEEAVDTTLRYIAKAGPGSWLIFTYVHRGVLDNSEEFDGTTNTMRLLQKQDEPWTFGLYPTELRTYLQARGFTLVEDTGSVQYRTRYLGARGRHLKGYEFYRIALARIERAPQKVSD
jgi:methyltransferase (TIGR00027 family)